MLLLLLRLVIAVGAEFAVVLLRHVIVVMFLLLLVRVRVGLEIAVADVAADAALSDREQVATVGVYDGLGRGRVDHG